MGALYYVCSYGCPHYAHNFHYYANSLCSKNLTIMPKKSHYYAQKKISRPLISYQKSQRNRLICLNRILCPDRQHNNKLSISILHVFCYRVWIPNMIEASTGPSSGAKHVPCWLPSLFSRIIPPQESQFRNCTKFQCIHLFISIFWHISEFFLTIMLA